LNAIILAVYSLLFIILSIRRRQDLFLSAHVILWSQFITFFIKALADGLRIAIGENINIYSDVMLVLTSVSISTRQLVLYFFIMNIGFLAIKL
jgi:hypothetical protein